MIKIEAENLKEAVRKSHALGKIEALEMIAEMIETGLVSNMDNMQSLVRAIRKSCTEQRKENGLETLENILDSDPDISKSDFDEIINLTKKK